MEVYRPGRRDPGADALGKTDQKLHPIVFILGPPPQEFSSARWGYKRPENARILRRAAPFRRRPAGISSKSKTVFFVSVILHVVDVHIINTDASDVRRVKVSQQCVAASGNTVALCQQRTGLGC